MQQCDVIPAPNGVCYISPTTFQSNVFFCYTSCVTSPSSFRSSTQCHRKHQNVCKMVPRTSRRANGEAFLSCPTKDLSFLLQLNFIMHFPCRLTLDMISLGTFNQALVEGKGFFEVFGIRYDPFNTYSGGNCRRQPEVRKEVQVDSSFGARTMYHHFMCACELIMI